jgi:hypothetical protein
MVIVVFVGVVATGSIPIAIVVVVIPVFTVGPVCLVAAAVSVIAAVATMGVVVFVVVFVVVGQAVAGGRVFPGGLGCGVEGTYAPCGGVLWHLDTNARKCPKQQSLRK